MIAQPKRITVPIPAPLQGIGSLAELQNHLGGVPLERILFQPLPGTATVQDLIELDVHHDRLCELVDGVLVEKTYGMLKARAGALFVAAVYNFVERFDLGVVTGAGGPFQLGRNLVLMPDVAFTSWKRFPGQQVPDLAVPKVVPDLAVEVLDRGKTKGEMARKLREYFKAGVHLAWLVDPKAKTVVVYTSATRSTVISASGKLDGGKVLPGFEVRVADVLARLKRRTKAGRRINFYKFANSKGWTKSKSSHVTQAIEVFQRTVGSRNRQS